METLSKQLFIKDLKVKESVEDIFLIKFMALMEGRDGRNYLNLILSDASGEIEARVWQVRPHLTQQFSQGHFVVAKGKVNLYQNRKQFIITELAEVSDPSAIKEADFIPHSQSDVEEMYQKLLAEIAKLDDVYIKDLLNAIVHDSEISQRLKSWPAGKTIHHAYKGGLLEHILSCTELSQILARHYQLNANFVVAGAILHDLCKIYELSSGTVTEYTDEGKLVGHLAGGLELIDRFIHKMPFFPRDTRTHLIHIILSHHGEYEYGSPKLPQTREAMLVHLVDFTDSKMNAFETIIKGDTNPGTWSGFNKNLNRIIYKTQLPKYSEYLKRPSEAPGPNNQEKSHSQKSKKNHAQEGPKELKTNMANLLKDYRPK